MMKRGYLTTEFWVLVLSNIAVVCASLAEALPAKYAAIFAGVSTSLYAFSRGIAKITVPNTSNGYLTTEFWATAATSVGLLIAALGDALPEKWAVYAGSLATGAYALARGISKISTDPASPPTP